MALNVDRLCFAIHQRIYFTFLVFLETFLNILENLGVYKYRNYAKLPDSLQGQVVVITGGSAGIGIVTAQEAAIRGARVVLAVRDLDKTHKVVASIEQECARQDVKKPEINIVKCDLSSLKSVREAATTIRDAYPVVHCLINNAGVMMCPKLQSTEGHELQFATNHLGHFLLTNLLLDRLEAAPVARVVNVSSLAHMNGTINFDEILNNDAGVQYNPVVAYSRSKLANVLFTRELAKRLRQTNVTVYAVHPGMVDTELARHMSTRIQSIIRKLTISAYLGAQTSLYCAFDERVANQSGFYYANCTRVKYLLKNATSDEDAERLWDVSTKLVGGDIKVQ